MTSAFLEPGGRRPQHLVRIGAGSDRLCRNIPGATQRTLLLFALGECRDGGLHHRPRLLRSPLTDALEHDAFDALTLVGSTQEVIQQGGRSSRCDQHNRQHS